MSPRHYEPWDCAPPVGDTIVCTNRAPASSPPAAWPYGPPDHHESCCVLFAGRDYCDCKASDASDEEFGIGEAAITAAERERRAAGQQL